FALRAGNEPWPEFAGEDPETVVAAWQDLEARGCKIRSRALTTTLFARLFLAEAFIHGIGGAKYDELTDELLARFYPLDPPCFFVVSATLLLPFPRTNVTAEQHRRLARARRDVWWNPQRPLAEDTPDP